MPYTQHISKSFEGTEKYILGFLNTLFILSIVIIAMPFDALAARKSISPLAITEGKTATRAQWVHELITVLALDERDERYPDLYFTDIDEKSECYESVITAAKYGILYFATGDEFCPDEPATREFAAQTMAFCLGLHLEIVFFKLFTFEVSTA